MVTDRLTKLLLAAIAIALWINAMTPWIRPIQVAAQAKGGEESTLQDAGRVLLDAVHSIDMKLLSISGGTCTNRKICGF